MEIWKNIDGYDGDYQVSNLGRVKSLKFGKEKILSPGTNKDNYLHVNLWKNKKMKPFLIHRLVAMTFLPNPNNFPEINHKDENPSNNNVDNLEWCSRSYNINYGSRNKKSSESQSMKVDQYTLDGKFLKTWCSMHQVERELGIRNSNISDCYRGRYKTAGKFVWKYHNCV